MRKKPKKDPVFGIQALRDFGEKAKAHIRPIPLKNAKLRRIQFKRTQLYKNNMHYIYTGEDE